LSHFVRHHRRLSFWSGRSIDGQPGAIIDIVPGFPCGDLKVFLLGKFEYFSSSDAAATVTSRLAWFIFATMPNSLDFLAGDLIMSVLEE
jgi:hypothetical protein